MAIFSIYSGFIYNEFFGKPLLIFDSCFPSFEMQKDCVYKFGIDWGWFLAENETSFVNSFKMKFAIVVGVVHMLLGTSMKIYNSID